MTPAAGDRCYSCRTEPCRCDVKDAHPLEVRGTFGGDARMGHGNRCVVLTVTSTHGNVGGIVMTPDEARTLARSLARQADNSEHVDPEHAEAPTAARGIQ